MMTRFGKCPFESGLFVLEKCTEPSKFLTVKMYGFLTVIPEINTTKKQVLGF